VPHTKPRALTADADPQVLFVLATGDQWSGYMKYMVKSNPFDAHAEPILHTLYPTFTGLYVISFQIIVRWAPHPRWWIGWGPW
jgi:hypothetical protein